MSSYYLFVKLSLFIKFQTLVHLKATLVVAVPTSEVGTMNLLLDNVNSSSMVAVILTVTCLTVKRLVTHSAAREVG